VPLTSETSLCLLRSLTLSLSLSLSLSLARTDYWLDRYARPILKTIRIGVKEEISGSKNRETTPSMNRRLNLVCPSLPSSSPLLTSLSADDGILLPPCGELHSRVFPMLCGPLVFRVCRRFTGKDLAHEIHRMSSCHRENHSFPVPPPFLSLEVSPLILLSLHQIHLPRESEDGSYLSGDLRSRGQQSGIPPF
jgi:hypothetical protein